MSAARAREVDGCGGSGETLRYLGQLIWPPFLLRLRRPQICVRCIDESGFCHAAWEFSCFCVCTAHECRLVDRCGRCGRGLRWFRPALDVCDCGAYLHDDGHGLPESEVVWFASEVLARSCCGDSGAATVGDFSFLEAFPWWRSISLSGLMQIVLACGVQTSSKPPSWGALHRTSTREWTELVSRGLKRLRLLGEATLESATGLDLRGLVWEGALESTALRPTIASDRDAALSILDLVFGPVAGARLRQQRVGRQLELFGVGQ